jgi:hypothetical protein
MEFKVADFRQSQFMRLHVLRRHIEERRLSENLDWLSLQPAAARVKEQAL